MLSKLAATALCIAALLGAGCASGPRYQNVHAYSEGLAAVQDKNGKWGYINEKQDWAIEPRFEDVQDFQNGRAGAKLNGKWGFINKKGDWL